MNEIKLEQIEKELERDCLAYREFFTLDWDEEDEL